MKIAKYQTWTVPYALLLVYLMGCATTDTARLYAGPQKPDEKIATLIAPYALTCPEILSVNGTKIEWQRRVELLPGSKKIEVSCKKRYPRDPFGGWSGREILELDAKAGHEYELRAITRGSGKSFSYGNYCTMRFIDKATGKTVSRMLRRVRPTGPFSYPNTLN